jgi:hypothetical protein
MKKFAAVLALGMFVVGCDNAAPPPATGPSSPDSSHMPPASAHEMTNDPAAAPATDPAAAPATDPAAPADPAAAPAADPAAVPNADAPAAPAP